MGEAFGRPVRPEGWRGLAQGTFRSAGPGRLIVCWRWFPGDNFKFFFQPKPNRPGIDELAFAAKSRLLDSPDMQDMELLINLQKFLMLFGFAVGLAIIVAAVALCFIATHTAAIRQELLKLRINAQMTSERASA